MHVAALQHKDHLLKAKCHQKKTWRVKLLDMDYKWIRKMQATGILFWNNLLDLVAVIYFQQKMLLNELNEPDT